MSTVSSIFASGAVAAPLDSHREFEPSAHDAVRHVHVIGKIETLFDPTVSALIWRRQAAHACIESVPADPVPRRRMGTLITTQATADGVARALDLQSASAICSDVAMLAELFATITGARMLGLRLESTDRATCPKFHVDRVLLRLIVAYEGAGTQFLAGDHIVPAQTGDVCLCKGEQWSGTTQGPAVHRSPDVPPGKRRTLLTIDALE